jgi:membrane associated rhomboid family serine protease
MANQADDRIEALVRIAARVGLNPVRVRWKLIRLEQRWQRWRHGVAQNLLHVRYAHQTCPACGSVNDRDGTKCSRCDAGLPRRRWQIPQRLGIMVPRALSVSTLLGIAILLVYGREMAARPGGGYLSVDNDVLIRFGALWPPLVKSGQWWRFSTAMFLHIGLWHLGFNLLALAQVGPLVEETFGRARMLFFFMLTGVLSFLGSYWLGVDGVTAGASGALMGLVGVAAGWGQRDGTSIGRSVRNHMLKWGAYTMVFGFFIGANNAAHASGFVAGVALGLATRPARFRRPQAIGWPDALLGLLGVIAALGTAGLALFPPRGSAFEDHAQRLTVEALEAYAREQYPQAWAATQHDRGDELQDEALRGDGADQARLLGEAVVAYRHALEVRTREQAPEDWAATQYGLGITLREQGIRATGDQRAKLLAWAQAAFRSALTVHVRDQLPERWQQTTEALRATCTAAGDAACVAETTASLAAGDSMSSP